MRKLAELGADLNARDVNQQTPLHFHAAMKGHASTCELLVELGADANARNFRQHTALHYAAREGHLHIAEVILEKHKNPDGNEASGDDSSKFRYNIDIHDHLSMNNQFGNTPLYFADYFASYWKKQQDIW